MTPPTNSSSSGAMAADTLKVDEVRLAALAIARAGSAAKVTPIRLCAIEADALKVGRLAAEIVRTGNATKVAAKFFPPTPPTMSTSKFAEMVEDEWTKIRVARDSEVATLKETLARVRGMRAAAIASQRPAKQRRGERRQIAEQQQAERHPDQDNACRIYNEFKIIRSSSDSPEEKLRAVDHLESCL